MANPYNKSTTKIHHSSQEMDNLSFDKDFNQNTQESLGYDGQNLQRNNASNLRVVYYSDSTYEYFALAAPGTSLSSANWLIKRVDTNGAVDYPGGSPSFNQAATNLTTVQGYTYS